MTVVWALTWLGQSAALAALTAVCVRLPGLRTSAAARHAAWAAALVFCAALLAWPMLPAPTTAPAFHAAAVPAGITSTRPVPAVVLPAPVTHVSAWLGWLWAVGTLAGLGLVARDGCQVVRLKRRTVPLSAEEQARLGQGFAASASRRAPRLAWCAELDTPAVLGFVRPVIALPRAQASLLLDSQSRFVVLHELAHIRRGDDWWVLAERIILAVAWVNPVLHWVLRELSVSREMACDEWVVEQTAAPVAYATCLADVVALRSQARRVRLATGVTGRPGTLRRRIVGVLALKGRTPARAAAIVAWVAPVAVCAAAAGLLRLPPVFVVADEPDAPLPALAQAADAGWVGRIPDDRPAPPTAAANPQVPTRQGRFTRRAVPAVTLESVSPVPPVTEMAAESSEPAGAEPLASSPLPLAGEPGVTAAAGDSAMYLSQTGDARRWSGPAAIGERAGGAAASAGRATASFFARFGSHVPQLLNR